VLCPRYKETYFKKALWPESWKKEAVHQLKEEWKNYKPKPVEKPMVKITPTVHMVPLPFFFDMDNFNLDLMQDELDQYLSSPPETSCADPIAYWSARVTSGSHLARLALDILSIPAMSVDVKHAFSRGCLTVSRLRHSLKDSTTCMATVLGSWNSIEGLIPEADLTSSFRDKTKRAKQDKEEGGMLGSLGNDLK
ncbi:hypothetical protein M422DRAFT_177585, partial [Sphaerobolus stellatus SS14]